jgi:hypothetical protein
MAKQNIEMNTIYPPQPLVEREIDNDIVNGIATGIAIDVEDLEVHQQKISVTHRLRIFGGISVAVIFTLCMLILIVSGVHEIVSTRGEEDSNTIMVAILVCVIGFMICCYCPCMTLISLDLKKLFKRYHICNM